MTAPTQQELAAAPRPGVPAERLPRVLEAVLMVCDEPIAAEDLAVGLGVPVAAVSEALGALAADLEAQERGFTLRHVGVGWRFYSHDDCAEEVARFLVAGQHGRLSAAALETLAVIAYRQPVSRARIAAVRGVNVDGVVRTLLARDLIAEHDTDASTGAVRYGTTPLFLEKLGVRSLDELPPLAPLLPDIEGLDDAPTHRVVPVVTGEAQPATGEHSPIEAEGDDRG